jgi:hypothetical protein
MALGGFDIAAMLADLAEAGGVVEITLGGEMPAVVAADEIVHVQSGVLPGLQSGAAITVGGTAYTVLKVLPYGDGAMVRVALRTP